MTKVTQKQIIESLSQLKEIKPRKEWAVLLKSQILPERKEATLVSIKIKKTILVPIKPQVQAEKSIGFMDILSSVFASRKLAYAFAVVLLFVAGVFGFARYTVPGDMLFPVKKIADQSVATLSGQTQLNQNVTALKNSVNDLAMVAGKKMTDNIPSAISEVKEAAKDLNANPTQDPQTIKDIAGSLKTLADVPGTDLSANSDVENLTKATVQDLITYYQGITLTAAQQNILAEAQDSYNNKDYNGALEKIWDLTNNTGNNSTSSISSTTSPTNK